MWQRYDEQYNEMCAVRYVLETRDEFTAILDRIDFSERTSVFLLMNEYNFYINLFLRHLMELQDTGVSWIQGIIEKFHSIFLTNYGNRFAYSLDSNVHTHSFGGVSEDYILSDKKLGTDYKGLFKPADMLGIHHDLVAMLLFACCCVDANIASYFEECKVGKLLTDKDALHVYLDERYAAIKKITDEYFQQ